MWEKNKQKTGYFAREGFAKIENLDIVVLCKLLNM